MNKMLIGAGMLVVLVGIGSGAGFSDDYIEGYVDAVSLYVTMSEYLSSTNDTEEYNRAVLMTNALTQAILWDYEGDISKFMFSLH